MAIRILLVGLGLVALGGTACDGGDDGDAQITAVRAVMSESGTSVSGDSPRVARDYECVIAGGGPYPGIRVPGVCRWDAEREDETWIVSEKQTWRCEDFNANIGREETCTGETGSHTWRYRVDASGRVEYLDESGIFPPEDVE